MLKACRNRVAEERGFSLMELLVVMLILGILATILVPAFLNQKTKASDSGAKATARVMQTAMEICGNEGSGFSGCDIARLRAIEKSIPQSGSTVAADPGNPPGGWSVSAESSNGNLFEIERDSNAVTTRNCTVPNGKERGGCPSSGNW